MTNEKDREEIIAFVNAIPFVKLESTEKYNEWKVEVANLIEHRDSHICSEAVQAERDRCIKRVIDETTRYWCDNIENKTLGGYHEAVRSALLTAEPDPCEDMNAAFQRMFCVSHLDMMDDDQKRLYETFKAGWTGASHVAYKRAEELRAENDRLTKRVSDLEKELATPILVNTARLADQLAAERSQVKTLMDAIKKLYRSYVNMMETARDRIISNGGTCDPVDVIEAQNNDLKESREALAATESKS